MIVMIVKGSDKGDEVKRALGEKGISIIFFLEVGRWEKGVGLREVWL